MSNRLKMFMPSNPSCFPRSELRTTSAAGPMFLGLFATGFYEDALMVVLRYGLSAELKNKRTLLMRFRFPFPPIITITMALTAPFASAFELDGFKNIKFGMSRSEVELIGFENCASETYSCFWSKPNYTILGRQTGHISVSFGNSGVDEIRVGYPKPPVAAIKDLTQAFGNPSKYNYQSIQGNQVTGHAWLTDSQSIALTITYLAGEENGRLRRSILGRGMVMDKTSTISFITGDDVKSVLKQIAESNAPLNSADI